MQRRKNNIFKSVIFLTLYIVHQIQVGVPSSPTVTDEGLAMLITGPCSKTLKRIKLRGTKVRVKSSFIKHEKNHHLQATGIQMLLSNCLSLEGVRHNSKDVIMALSAFLKEERQRVDGSLLTLAYMDFTSCFTVFSKRLQLLPGLTEVSSRLYMTLLCILVR